MKRNSLILPASLALFFIAAVLLGACSSAKNIPANAEAITRAIDSSHWKFTATQVMPQYGNSGPTNGSYEVSLGNGKLFVNLPYFGRADAGANILTGRGPLDFTSTDFSMDKQQSKKGKWLITIKPRDNRDVQAMNFTLFSSGSASVTIVLNNRTPISFSGWVEAGK